MNFITFLKIKFPKDLDNIYTFYKNNKNIIDEKKLLNQKYWNFYLNNKEQFIKEQILIKANLFYNKYFKEYTTNENKLKFYNFFFNNKVMINFFFKKKENNDYFILVDFIEEHNTLKKEKKEEFFTKESFEKFIFFYDKYFNKKGFIELSLDNQYVISEIFCDHFCINDINIFKKSTVNKKIFILFNFQENISKYSACFFTIDSSNIISDIFNWYNKSIENYKFNILKYHHQSIKELNFYNESENSLIYNYSKNYKFSKTFNIKKITTADLFFLSQKFYTNRMFFYFFMKNLKQIDLIYIYLFDIIYFNEDITNFLIEKGILKSEVFIKKINENKMDFSSYINDYDNKNKKKLNYFKNNIKNKLQIKSKININNYFKFLNDSKIYDDDYIINNNFNSLFFKNLVFDFYFDVKKITLTIEKIKKTPNILNNFNNYDLNNFIDIIIQNNSYLNNCELIVDILYLILCNYQNLLTQQIKNRIFIFFMTNINKSNSYILDLLKYFDKYQMTYYLSICNNLDFINFIDIDKTSNINEILYSLNKEIIITKEFVSILVSKKIFSEYVLWIISKNKNKSLFYFYLSKFYLNKNLIDKKTMNRIKDYNIYEIQFKYN